MSNLRNDSSRPSAAVSNRNFGFVFTGFLSIVGTAPMLAGYPVNRWALAGAALFLVAALIAPRFLEPLNRLWTQLGLALHRITSPIALGVLLYLVLTPVGLILRLSGKDILRLRWKPHAQSYWILRDPPGPAAETMRNQF